MTLRDELDGATLIEKNVDTPQEMEFSTPITDVIDHPVISQAIAQQAMESSAPPAKKVSSKQQYPLNLKKEQVEALIAGLAGVIGFSDIVQNKVIDMIPQSLNEAGKLTLTGLGITAVIIAVIFYFLRQFILK